MSHQPFEKWIINRETLTPSQISELDTHLKSCPQCSQIYHGWRGVENLLQKPAFVHAPPHFAHRFQVSLAERKARERKRQVRIALFGIGGVFVLLSMVFFLRLILTIPPAQLLSDIIGWVAYTPQRIAEFRFILYFWGTQIPPLALVAAFLILGGWSVLLLSIWFVTIRRLSYQGVPRQ